MAISLIVIALATLMLWGWGQAFRRALSLEPGTWPSTVALGMAVVVFLGGILNLARIVYPWALALVSVTGMLLSLIALRPVRMLETGTVFGSPLSAMGMQTLGAQAFLDGFAVAFFPIQYINGVDAVFGLFLCLILASQITQHRLMTMVCMLSVIYINPQHVNISTLYCGSALIMAIACETVLRRWDCCVPH
jgi:hypothetical protein